MRLEAKITDKVNELAEKTATSMRMSIEGLFTLYVGINLINLDKPGYMILDKGKYQEYLAQEEGGKVHLNLWRTYFPIHFHNVPVSLIKPFNDFLNSLIDEQLVTESVTEVATM